MMRWLALLGVAASLFGCRLKIDDYLDRACDDKHPCPTGRDCVLQRCVDPETGIDACPVFPAKYSLYQTAWEEQVIDGDPRTNTGNFSPSLAFPADQPEGLLAYSDIDGLQTNGMLAVGQGSTWTQQPTVVMTSAIVISTTDTTACPTGSCTGNMVHDWPSVVDDSTDPDSASRFKYLVLSHFRSLSGTDTVVWGYLELFTSPSVDGPWASRPLIGWNSSSSVSSLPTMQIKQMPGIQDCSLLVHPSLSLSEEGLDLVVRCPYLLGTGYRPRIVLLRSSDHSATFHFVADLVLPADLACLNPGVDSIGVPHLLQVDGRHYLSVTNTASNNALEGCLVLPFDDFHAGTLQRHPSGNLVLLRKIDTGNGQLFGSCTGAEGIRDKGYLLGTHDANDPAPTRRLRWTNEPLP
jgi:hypothetical protein